VTRGQFKQFVDAEGYKTEGEADGTGGIVFVVANKYWDRDAKCTWRNPGFTQTDEHPVVLVSWNDAVAFCKWLSRKDGREYRLPSEAEWEFACRAGSKTRYHFGDEDEELAKHGNGADADYRAATKTTSGIKASDGYGFTAPVGKFKPNAFGLYDMHGNAWEWCQDYYGAYDKLTGNTNPIQSVKQSDERRVLRGGSWYYYACYCRVANRSYSLPDDRDTIKGFRVVCLD
jgi:formylglycine-generating enzyme required for sulfatase activity